MLSSGLAIIVLVLCSASCGDDPPGQPPPTRTPAEKLRGLSADFDRETQAANAQRGTRPDPAAAQAYARRFLHLARECPDESVAVDALIWVLRHDRNGPLVKEAIARSRLGISGAIACAIFAGCFSAKGRRESASRSCGESWRRIRIRKFAAGPVSASGFIREGWRRSSEG